MTYNWGIYTENKKTLERNLTLTLQLTGLHEACAMAASQIRRFKFKLDEYDNEKHDYVLLDLEEQVEKVEAQAAVLSHLLRTSNELRTALEAARFASDVSSSMVVD